MQESNTRTTSAFSLLALLLAAAAFKDELKAIYLPLPHVSLLSVFVVVTILVSTLLVLYLIIDLKTGTVLEQKLNTNRLKLVLDHVFLVILLAFFVIAEVVIQLLNLTIGYQQVSILISSITLGAFLGLRTIVDKRQYGKYLNTLTEQERLIKLKIMSARGYLSTINSPRLRYDIESDISRFEKELSGLAYEADKKNK